MCRYGYQDYKSHFACFDCRKTFKKTSITDWVKRKGLDLAYKRLLWRGDHKARKRAEAEFNTTYEVIRDRYLEDVSACPQCRKNMAAMGFDFRAPKHSAVEQWQIITLLYNNGFAFHGCGCSVGYAPPDKLSDLDDFFRRHERLSEGEQLLESIKINRA